MLTVPPAYRICGMPAEFPDETGGALINTGVLKVVNTVFKENMAMDGGLAVQRQDSDVTVLRNVTFDGNILGCPAQTYSYTRDVSTSNWTYP